MRRLDPNVLVALAGAAVGLAFAAYLYGFRLLDPRSVEWLMGESDPLHQFLEDSHIFPDVCTRGGPAVAAVVDQLSTHHKQIDPLLERGDVAFESLPASVQDASAVVRDIAALLDEHLALEEPTVIPFLRDAKAFPPPPTDADAEMYATASPGAPTASPTTSSAASYAMLSDALTTRLPAAREAYRKRAENVWGTAEIATSRTSVPVG